MLNISWINTVAINSWKLPRAIASGVLTLNWLDIATWDIKATNIQDDTIVNVSWYDIPQNNWRGFLSNFKRWRQIKMTVYIKWANQTEFIANLDAFRKACFTPNAVLDWKKDWIIRRIKVNCTANPQIFNHYNLDFLRMEVSFESLEPFWYRLDSQSTSIFAQTASFQEEITSIWTAQSDVVSYILFWNTNSTQVKMKIWEYEIIINHTFANNDILKIDWEWKRVYVNDTVVDYSWIFPFMSPWTNFFTFTMNGTFTCDVLILNKKNYV